MKISAINKVLEKCNANAIIIEDEKQRKYFTDFSASFGFLLLSIEGNIFATDPRYIESAEKKISCNEINVVCLKSSKEFFEIVKNKKFDRVAIDLSIASHTFFEEVSSSCKTVVDCSNEIAETMAIKNDEELESIKQASIIAEKSFLEILPLIKEGVSENDICAELEYRMRKNGGEGASFETIVAFNQGSSVPHHETSKTVLKKNMPILIDFGTLVNGYCSDITRTFYFGKPSNKFIEMYEKVYNAHMLSAQNIKANMISREADKIARDYFKDYDLEKHFTHSLGHGIGVNIHENPYLSPKGNMTLKNNMVFSIEPGLYFENEFGIRIEDTCFLSNDKVQSLMTLTDKKLLIL